MKGSYRVKRKTSSKKFRASLRKVKEWLQTNRILPLGMIMKKLRQKLIGYYRYYGITDNSPDLSKFRYLVRRLVYKWLNRRSQRESYSWESFDIMFKSYRIPYPKIYVNIFQRKSTISYIL